MTAFTIIDDGAAHEISGEAAGDDIRIAPASLEAALGWHIEPRGLCKDDLCYPLAAGSTLVDERGVSLAGLAAMLERPLALDVAEGAAFMGAAAGERAARLASLEAPDFTLPDLDGRLHSLSDHRGKKVLLAAYASW